MTLTIFKEKSVPDNDVFSVLARVAINLGLILEFSNDGGAKIGIVTRLVVCEPKNYKAIF